MTEQTEVQEVTATATASTETVAAAPKKIDIAAGVYTACQSLDKPRATYMNIMMTDHGLSKNCAASYYQMLKMEAEGKGRYKHHKAKPKAKAVAIVQATVPAEATEIASESTELQEAV